MSAPAIFVSHSHKDDAYCHALVAGLRAAGLHVWYDEHNASSGHLRTLIERELRLRLVERSLALDSNEGSTWNNKGRALFGLGRCQEALDAFDHALSMKPSATLWQNKVATLRQLGRTAEADAAERKAKEFKARQ